jgi:signal transduction histidine kinase
LLAAIAIGSAAARTGLGWAMLRLADQAETQRAAERLNHDADLAVQGFDRLLAKAGDDLADLASSPDAPVALPGNGLVVRVTATRVEPVTGAVLLYVPVVAERAEAPAALFAGGEAAEYSGHPDQAADAYRQLARAPAATTRAAALVGLARVLRTHGRADQALAAYTHLSTLGDTPVLGLPAELVAREARLDLLATTGNVKAAAEEARALRSDLARARWALTRGQFEQALDVTSAAGGLSGGPAAADLARAAAVADGWRLWQLTPASRGRQTMRLGDRTFLLLWAGTAERAAVWVVEPASLLRSLTLDASLRVTMSDADGFRVAGPADRLPGDVVRAAAETRLPWTLHVGRSATIAPTASTRRELIIAGLLLMAVFLAAGSYAIGRAVSRELELARMQAGFVSAVSHEFRTPLAAMRQLSELLAAGRVARDDKRQQYYESLAAESRRLQRLVENLLNIGRLEARVPPPPREPVDAAALLRAVVDDFQAQLARPACQIEVSASTGAAVIMADREALALAVSNLLDNAVKYGGAGRRVHVAWARQGQRVALSVRDEGPGISADEQRQIFRKFVRGAAAAATKARGTGVGLAMVQQIALNHGGEVRVDSQPGAGATFTLFLPLADAP